MKLTTDAFPNPVEPSLIMGVVCSHYDVSAESLIGSNKQKMIAEPRRVAMYLMYKLCNKSIVEIGTIFNRDHTTVFHSVNRVETELAKNIPLCEWIEEICSDLGK